MSNTILLMVLLSCFFHAGWNLASRHWRDREGFVWGVVVWSGLWAIATLPWSANHLVWSSALLPWVLMTGGGLGIYYICLRQAYRQGEVTLVYPLIRSAPLWVALISAAFLGEDFHPVAWIGLLAAMGGVFLLPLERLHWRALAGWKIGWTSPATLFALAASLGTSIYTLSDKMAMTQATDWGAGPLFRALTVPLGLAVWAMVERSGAYGGFNWQRMSALGVPVWVTAGSGFCLFAAFSLVVSALIEGGAGRVLAITNLGVVLGALGGIYLLKERRALGPRLAGLGLTVLGILLLRWF